MKKSLFSLIAILLMSALAFLLIPRLRVVSGSSHYSGLQTAATRRLRSAQVPGTPVEIIEVKYNGVRINPNESISNEAGWEDKILFTVRNVSDKPITFLSIEVLLSGAQPKTFDGSLYMQYGSKNPDETTAPIIAPNDTVILKPLDSTGEINGTHDALIQVEEVIWNRDDSIAWHTGKMVRKVNTNPVKWVPVDEPQTLLNINNARPQFIMASMTTAFEDPCEDFGDCEYTNTCTKKMGI